MQKAYILRCIIFIFLTVLSDTNISTSVKSRKKLVKNDDVELYTARLKTEDFHSIIFQSIENTVTLEDLFMVKRSYIIY